MLASYSTELPPLLVSKGMLSSGTPSLSFAEDTWDCNSLAEAVCLGGVSAVTSTQPTSVNAHLDKLSADWFNLPGR